MSTIIYQKPHDIAKFMALKLAAISHSKKESIHIALSGGSTPKAIFQYISESDKTYSINWSRLHFWWADERCVQIESPESNYGEAKRILFDHININTQNLHPMNGTMPPKEAALSYQQSLKEHLPIENNLPYFDWIWLGMGDDGHTASLFPHGVPLNTSDWTAVAEHPTSKQNRITLTLCVLNNAKTIDFLVTGESKAKMLKKVLEDKIDAINYPAKSIKPTTGEILWHIDKTAAVHLG